MNINIKDVSQIENIISICDKYTSLYNRDILDECLYSKTSSTYMFPSLLGDKLFEIINRRALKELLPYLSGYEHILDDYYEIVSTPFFQDFVQKRWAVKNGKPLSYCTGTILENGDDLSYFNCKSNPFGLVLSNYCPSFFNEVSFPIYRNMYLGKGIALEDMEKEELFPIFFSNINNLEAVPDLLVEQFQDDCSYSEEGVTYVVRTSNIVPAFEHWDNVFDVVKDPEYRRLAREAIKELKAQDYVYSYIGMDDICYCFEDRDTYYDVRRIYEDPYSNIIADDRYLYPDVFFKNLKLEVILIYLNQKYHFFQDVKKEVP